MMADAQDPDHFGWVMAHFIEEPDGYGERIHLSRTVGTDARRWEPVNGGRPVLQSDVGTSGVRDPFLVRTDAGFHLLATDLRIYGGDAAGWDEWQRHGSRSLITWQSPDLANWSPARSVEVAPHTAGMAWAPKVKRDEAADDFIVYWSSTLYREHDHDHQGESYSRILSSRTRDFHEFSPAKVLVDRGTQIIDMCSISWGGREHRFLKEDRYSDESRRLHEEVGSDFFADDFVLVAQRLGEDRHRRVEGPLVYRDAQRQVWYLLVDQFDVAPQGYVAYWTPRLGSGDWRPLTAEEFTIPAGTKHGSVLPISRREWEALGGIDVDLDANRS